MKRARYIKSPEAVLRILLLHLANGYSLAETATRAQVAGLGRRVRAVDATTVCEQGSTGGDWRVHYAVNLGDLQCDFFQLTELHRSGETFRRVPVS